MYRIIESLQDTVEIVKEQRNNAVLSGLYNTAQMLLDKEHELLAIIEKLENALYSVEA